MARNLGSCTWCLLQCIVGAWAVVTSDLEAIKLLNDLSASCVEDSGGPMPCTPFPPLDLGRAPLTDVRSSSTCSNEVYCIQGQDGAECRNCSRLFSIGNLKDGQTSDVSRWQSSNLQSSNERVQLQMDFNLPSLILFQVKMDLPNFQSQPLTGLEVDRSHDYGLTWERLANFRRNCPSTPSLSSCTNFTQTSTLQEIPMLEFVGIRDVATAFTNETNMEEFLARTPFTTSIRLTFLGIEEPASTDISLFYALAELQVIGLPFCNGHGRMFDPGNATQPCTCAHGASGRTCNTCNGQPLPPSSVASTSSCDTPTASTATTALASVSTLPPTTDAVQTIPSTSTTHVTSTRRAVTPSRITSVPGVLTSPQGGDNQSTLRTTATQPPTATSDVFNGTVSDAPTATSDVFNGTESDALATASTRNATNNANSTEQPQTSAIPASQDSSGNSAEDDEQFSSGTLIIILVVVVVDLLIVLLIVVLVCKKRANKWNRRSAAQPEVVLIHDKDGAHSVKLQPVPVMEDPFVHVYDSRGVYSVHIRANQAADDGPATLPDLHGDNDGSIGINTPNWDDSLDSSVNHSISTSH
eukprot:scpid56169/ scgid2867/ Laminin subunit alpha-3; Epiligrin subunit alpha; Kalinin subunit alpha; Laminin-5 subunit alpha; Laminin-6 subunit alpha; Laminin-7 subunit alpha; Nicein subunit alpha